MKVRSSNMKKTGITMTHHSKRAYGWAHLKQTSLAMGMVAATLVVSSAAFAQQLTQMTAIQPSAQTSQLRMTFTGTPVVPTAYELENPSRLVLDFEGVDNAMAQQLQRFDVGLIDSVTTLSGDSTTRLIVALKDAGDYSTAIEGQQLLLNIHNPAATPALVSVPVTPMVETTTVVTQPAVTTVATEPSPQGTMTVRVNPLLNPASAVTQQYSLDGLSAVNYSGNSDGGGSISIALANESIPVDVQRQGNKLVIRMPGATVPRHLLRRLNVNGGLVASIDANNQGQNGVITINMTGDYEYQAFQSGNQLNVTINQPKMLREPTLEEKVYTGEALSMEFQDVAVRSVLDILAQFTEMNIVASDSVSGNITLRLINVPWDQALDIILKSKGLGKRENGNVILVAPAAELAEQEAKELEAQQKVDSFAPLRTEYIRLSYAKAADILSLISQGRSSGSAGTTNRNDSGSLLSERGTVTIDERTNTLIVKDTSDSIENVRSLIEKIDIPVKQVMIEARIVSATDSFSKELGVRWGILSNGAANNRNLLVGGSDQTLWDLKEFDYQTTTINGQSVSYPSYNISRPDNLNVDLGVANAAGRIAFGLLSMSDLMIDLELSAMQADGRGEVISTPKVLTADKQTAKVASGTQIPYQEASASGATSTSFIEAALSLEVTPNITPEGKIGMELAINSDAPRQLATGQYAIDTNSVTTNVVVEDGQTVVLGGVFRNRISNDQSKVPFLGDLPYVGRLFKKDVRSNAKEELLIFVTPKLINDGVSRYN